MTPSVYTIPSEIPFADALASGLMELAGSAPDALSGFTLLLPTRRSCRAVRDAFLRLSGGAPLLLPNMHTLGDVDEDELLFSFEESTTTSGTDIAAIPPAISSLRRQILLTRLVMAGRKTTPDQAAVLATELARLLDQIHTERLSFDDLPDLVPDKFAKHWQITIEFLDIIIREWPKLLASEGTLDPADRRNRLLAAQVEAWAANPPGGPVIAAGSTGSIPATADLLKALAHLPNGKVILPGLNTNADDETWLNLKPQHPQFGMSRLINHIGIDRRAVKLWNSEIVGITAHRSLLLNEALRPAAATHPNKKAIDPASPDQIKEFEEALNGVCRIDCPTPLEEAGAIALLMRETLETPGKTAALITPDRNLARRVAAELHRWDIEIDDSAGIPLGQTPPGNFLRLTARMGAEGCAPVPLLATLKHPLATGGMGAGEFRHGVRALEMAALRGPRPDRGIRGLRDVLKETEQAAHRILDTLETVCDDYLAMFENSAVSVSALLEAHITMAEKLAETDDCSGQARIWVGEAGETLAGFISELNESIDSLGPIPPTLYPALLDTLIAGRPVRPGYGRHPRLFIWGLLEARLQQADRMILGGLNEGSWPPEAQANPWMSRPMLSDFGLPQPEQRIGLTAHDFAQAFASPNVYLTRAERVDGTPTVASRWLLRLDNTLEKINRDAENQRQIAIASGHQPLNWFSQIDARKVKRTISPPRPMPPVAMRPRQLSVTRIETWIRDPYAIYAEKILRLRPLDPIDADPGAADRGNIIHKVLDLFIKAYPKELPDDALPRLLEIGADVFDTHMARPGIRAFWWPRFRRIADWFISWERRCRLAGITNVATEIEGKLIIPMDSSASFTLTAKADRIDRNLDASLMVIDYKTGVPPSGKQVDSGLVPQLSLEAAMIQGKAFLGIAPAPIDALIYLQLSGGRLPGKESRLKLDAEENATRALEGLKSLIADFDKVETPYLSGPRPMFIGRFGNYDHLARVKEWNSGDNPHDEGGDTG